MATSSSSAAVAALVQKASVQYMECRRKVTAKVDEVRAIDEQLQAAFAAMDMLRERGGASARSVGRLTLTLAGVEGDAPVPAAAITVAIDPEFESDEDDFEEVEEVVEKRDVVTTDEHGHVVEAGAVPHEHEGGETPRKLKTTTKITRTIIKKKVKKAKVPVVRTVAWDAVAVEDEEEQEKNDEEQAEEQAEGDEQKKEIEEAAPKPLSFPATFVFDPVQSREAVIIITVASASEEDAEPVKEVEIPISSLFGEDVKLDKWYSFVDEAAAAVVEAAEETAEVVEEAVKVEETTKVEEAEESEKTETQDEAAEDKDEETVEGEKADEEQKEVTAEVEETTETEAVEAVEAVAEKEPAAPVSRFHVQASFVMSDIEKLSAAAMALSKKKQEADAALQALEREAASLRTKYERLNASQRTLSSSSASKPKSGLLSSRFGQPVVQKSRFQKLRESVSAVFTPQRQQVLTSVAIFVTSVAVFHYQGENLLM